MVSCNDATMQLAPIYTILKMVFRRLLSYIRTTRRFPKPENHIHFGTPKISKGAPQYFGCFFEKNSQNTEGPLSADARAYLYV
jgi:hypothetical protein